MAQVVNLTLLNKPSTFFLPHPSSSSSYLVNFGALSYHLRCNPRLTCLFPANRNKQEQARKALEGALGGNKEKFEKWNQEIKKREEAGGGGGSGGGGGGGGGGGDGGGGWFGWSGQFGDRFWQEAQQFSLAILGILVLYLVAAKGDLLLAVTINPLLFALRSARNSFSHLTSELTRRLYPASNPKLEDVPVEPKRLSAKERVVSKWGTD
ncbi:hypothetical protein RND81_10G002200 [Saponaria officinalis]|uniref:Uncharacterized protein n=1 Tax=Saponaria officinalis TaxID=3572 RepID=A0AAW1HZ34_SAPOF